MPRIKTQFESELSLDPMGVMGEATLVPADFYMSTVLKVKYRETYHKHSVVNPDHKRGFQRYAKLTPMIQLHDENGTMLERQEVVLGVLDEDDILFRPQEDGKSPIWGGEGGALFMLIALGLITRSEETGLLTLDQDTDDIKNQIVRIKTSYNGYIKGKSNWESSQMEEFLATVNNNVMPSFDLIPAYILLYNVQKCGSMIYRDGVIVDNPAIVDCDLALNENEPNVKAIENDKRLRIQTCITGWYGLTAEEVIEHGYYADGLKVYASEPSDENDTLGDSW